MISSPANPHVKYIRSLAADRRERRRERLFVLEGVRLVADALAHGAQFTSLLFDPQHLAHTPEGDALLAQLREYPGAIAATPQVIGAASDTQHPQGVVGVARWPIIEPSSSGLIVVLEGVQDPGNMGTLLRSAEAVAVSQVLCLAGTVDVYSPKVARAGMGAHFRLSVEQDLTWEAVSAKLAYVDHVYAADADAAMPYYAADWRQNSALVLGSEAHGLTDEAYGYVSKTIAIPMRGGAESLNVAVAGSVILFEALRQRTRGRT